MRYLLSALFALIFFPAHSASEQELGSMWERANAAYVEGDYSRAIVTYDSIATTGYVSDKLYYNLGNAWFKEGKIGMAILNYNRALRLDPSDSDIRHNLQIANAYTKDKIEAVPEFFLTVWIRAWRQSLSADMWAVVSLVMVAICLGAVLLYLLSRNITVRKAGFFTGIIALVLVVFAVSFSVGQKREMTSETSAIVMAGSVPVKSSPDTNSKDIFILHEGTKVDIISTLNNWKEVSIADGKKGWIEQSALEII